MDKAIFYHLGGACRLDYCEKLQTLDHPEQYLWSGLTMQLLEQFSKQLSDTEAAEAMQKAKRELFRLFRTNSQKTG